MVTTVGTGGDMPTLSENLILLERDAIAAYDATIERLSDRTHRERISEFRADHERHLSELSQMAPRYGANVPAEGDAKQYLTTGKIQIAGLASGDSPLLKAMSSNETDTISAYENASKNSVVPAEDRPVFERALSDERRHKQYMDSASRS
jgi:rubrerythrin